MGRDESLPRSREPLRPARRPQTEAAWTRRARPRAFAGGVVYKKGRSLDLLEGLGLPRWRPDGQETDIRHLFHSFSQLASPDPLFLPRRVEGFLDTDGHG